MKRIKLFKRIQTSRVLLSTALCSVVLVVFSAVVFGAAAGSALTGDKESPLFSFLVGAEEEILPDETPLAASNTLSVADEIASLTLASPTLQPLAAQKADGTDPSASTSSASVSTASSQEAASTSEESSASVDEKAEVAYRAHIVKYYGELVSHYNHLCAGLNNAYAQINADDGSGRSVSVAPVEPETYIYTIDKKRQEAQTCTYNGKHIDTDSKWYDAYEKVWRMYENLTNVASVVREINGLYPYQARERLEYYSNSSGKIRELVQFEQRYSQVRF